VTLRKTPMPLDASESQKELIMTDDTIECPFCEHPVPINALPAHIVDVHSD
jgi:hypothetical protein